MEKDGQSLSFMDQCTVICLGYVASRGRLEIQSGGAEDETELGALCDVADQELQGFGEQGELQPFTDAASHLAKTYENASEKLQECLQKLQEYRSLEQEAFSESANQFIEPPIESWEKVAQLLQFIFKACERHGTAKVGTVIDISVRYMRNALSDFVTSQGGWRSLAFPQPEVEPEQSDISMSIVVVKREPVPEEMAQQAVENAAGDASDAGKVAPSPSDENASATLESAALSSPKHETALPLSPLNTPPFSIPSSVNTDDERDSLATPPEMVERPLLTESYIQAMGADEFRRVSSTSGNDFELIGSDNGGTTDSQSGTKSIEDAQAVEPGNTEKEEPQDLLQTQSASGESTPEVQQTPEGQSTPKIEEAHEEPVLGGYLPHISIGVAAAAAVAGFFVLKKNM